MIRLDVPTVVDLAWLARNMRADEVEQFSAMTGILTNIGDAAGLSAANAHGPRLALYDGGMPIMAAGLEPIRPGVAELWGIGTPQGWADHWRTISLHARRMVRNGLESEFHRIQIQAIASRTLAHEWYRRVLGMRYEATLARADAHGRDLLVFSRVRA